MTTVELALDSFVASSTGPVLCGDVGPGTELVLVGRDGRFGEAEVQRVVQLGEQDVGQLLTSVGDVKIPVSTSIITRRGIERVSDLIGDSAASTRVELVRPADLPQANGPRAVTSADILAALGSFDHPVVMIPTVRSDLDALMDTIEGYLERSGVEYEIEESDRWATFVFSRIGRARSGDLWAQAQVLAQLTAWTDEDGSMRTRLCDDSLRRRLLAGLVAAAVAPAVQWVPAYRPAECRVSEQFEWKPFSPVHSARVGREPALRVEVTGVGRLVCGLTIVGSGG